MNKENSQVLNVRLRTLTLFFWGFLIASAAIAGEEHRIEIAIDDNGRSEFRFDSHDADIDLYELEVGESRTYTDDDGNDVTVTRNEGSFEFEVAGDEIVVADLLNDEHNLRLLHLAHEGEHLVVEKHHKVHRVDTDANVGVTIISGDEIDVETRARIEQVLKEADEDGEIVFIDSSDPTGDEGADRKHEVRIIKKQINVTN